MAHIHDLTALEQAHAVRKRELSPVEITQHYLERIERLGPGVGAFVTVTADRALAQAREQEARLAGAADPADLPPLLGVPVPIKDLNLVKDVPIYFGSATYEGFVAPVDDSVVERLRDAGTIMLGKTSTPEFGLPCYTETYVNEPARTPWDPSRSAGGSSGGAAAAVAAGLAPAAQGSDGAGSIRIPASVCGLYGIKPTRGRISFAPIVPDLAGLSTNGPITRTVADAAALLDVMAHNNPGDLYWAPPPALGSFSAYVGREPGRMRIARYATPVVPGAEVHPDVLAAYESASAVLESLGHEVVEISAPFGADMVPEFVKLWFSFSCMHPVAPELEPKLRPLTAWLRERGDAVTAPEFLQAQSALQLATRFAMLVTDEYDAVLTPTVTQPPVPVGWFEDVDSPEETFERMKRFAPFAAMYNVSGQPAVNLPLYWTPDGLPIGVMLAGRFGDEGTLISLSSQVEQSVGGFWGDRRPPVW
ncbi:amidase [Microbispora sp. ATCC PTA-5024]|uniref:amidase n=1 Tax=Microbispora sp. ATCC PTA-5024 TaxID=316330 RepID=UPI0003DBA414|nr:amidase [Microbispora sp. ATCC PTA-5024]ETK31355.1 amidase [Microbispora sp. ATCC PTA-5024]